MNRNQSIQEIQICEQWDLVIIGGGATGLGCAVDAANRGYKTLLLEKNDFAKGTSSRSTKLLHGGVRYLEQGNIRLVREALLERGRLMKNAPHLCRRLPFIVPFYKWWQKWYYGTGLWLYDFLSGQHSIGKTKFLSKKGTLKNLPGLNGESIHGGILYFDGQFDDARVAISLAQTAVAQGATVVNYCGVTGFLKSGEAIQGVVARDKLTNKVFPIKSKAVINATGVFADELLRLAQGDHEATITPSQGVHLVVDKQFFEGTAALMIPQTDDGRVLFAIPWYNKVLLGTTDTTVDEIREEPRALKDEIDFIIGHFNRFSASGIGYRDIRSVFAGLRPLARIRGQQKTAVMPRDHHVSVPTPGLVHVTGGKWTTYRGMAEHAVNQSAVVAGLEKKRCNTHTLQLHGYSTCNAGLHLDIYGTDAVEIARLLESDPALSEKIHPQYPYTKAEVQWMTREEMAITVEDILARRTRLLFIDAAAAVYAAPVVASIMAQQLNHNDEWIAKQLAEFYATADAYQCKPLA